MLVKSPLLLWFNPIIFFRLIFFKTFALMKLYIPIWFSQMLKYLKKSNSDNSDLFYPILLLKNPMVYIIFLALNPCCSQVSIRHRDPRCPYRCRGAEPGRPMTSRLDGSSKPRGKPVVSYVLGVVQITMVYR
jgi:hypothetical protein